MFLVVPLKAEITEDAPMVKALLSTLAEAEGYIRVKPTLASSLLKGQQAQIKSLTNKEQLRWHQALIRVSVALNDTAQLEKSAIAMFSNSALKNEQDKLISLYSGLGITMRRFGHFSESISLFDCALNQPITDHRQQVSLMLSKGISLRHIYKLGDAKDIYLQALAIAEQQREDDFISAIHNALGIMALYENDYSYAKQQLLLAMQVSQRNARRSGHIISGLNLLLIAILENDLMLYHRLHSPISKLTLATQNLDRHHYLFWIEKAYQVNSNKALSLSEEQELLHRLGKIKDFTLHNLLVQKLAKMLDIKTLPREREHSEYQGKLLKYFQQCLW
ncbi:hypothetical protein [Thalassotalea atypica]|uniref:hypothetical protein n=1 Tax=Thalassotalea atypica TaxID=2054316 RepID=UPI00257262D2|nr:hypothetical protein [Thalassotalea atypica]